LDRYVETGQGREARDDVLEVTGVLPRDKAYRTREPMEAYGIVELSMAGAA
jgi:hypothetical protein